MCKRHVRWLDRYYHVIPRSRAIIQLKALVWGEGVMAQPYEYENHDTSLPLCLHNRHRHAPEVLLSCTMCLHLSLFLALCSQPVDEESPRPRSADDVSLEPRQFMGYSFPHGCLTYRELVQLEKDKKKRYPCSDTRCSNCLSRIGCHDPDLHLLLPSYISLHAANGTPAGN